MKTKLIEMPEVAACDATECAYNESGDCHARAITVGDSVHPDCDTFLRSQDHRHAADTAGVGACKVRACKHNEDFECQADAIRVGHRSSRVECLTYTQR